MAPAPGARPGGPGRWPPVSGPSGACSGCVRTAAGAPPHRGGAQGKSFDAPHARPNLSRARHAATGTTKQERRWHGTKKAARFPRSLVCEFEKGMKIGGIHNLQEDHNGGVNDVCWRYNFKVRSALNPRGGRATKMVVTSLRNSRKTFFCVHGPENSPLLARAPKHDTEKKRKKDERPTPSAAKQRRRISARSCEMRAPSGPLGSAARRGAVRRRAAWSVAA